MPPLERRSLVTVAKCKDKRVKRKSTTSLLASANRTLLLFVSIRSFKLTVAMSVVAIHAILRTEDKGSICLSV
ncbi:hypothetical protein Pyn_32239 [Prunus yedoensis var. nudiflora]|uniref:Uncharacterized protein n=1 Tax=Prunus yedoensis var. nudiflora TaxID=2094558 RepID=A0A314UBT7_PRUYE|nr:hypothetical protein Pyn_32239 [Prunus yedoensis var. nudiflora]